MIPRGRAQRTRLGTPPTGVEVPAGRDQQRRKRTLSGVHAHRGAVLILLLCGGDKSTQQKNIETAKKLARGDTMSKAKTKPFDPAEYLDDSESIAAYMTDALDSGDPAFVADALGVVARASGMSEVAREAGVSRESLYRAQSADGNSEFATVLRVVRALGLRLWAAPIEPGKVA